MVQYSTDINDNAGKFPFGITYNYDIKFRLKCQVNAALPWNEIDNRLWSKCFAGSNRDSSFSSVDFCAPNTSITEDNKTCRDFNNGICTRSICKFQHKCSKCFTPDIASINVGNSKWSQLYKQLNPAIFQPIMPIWASRFKELLNAHPNKTLMEYVITSFRQGFLLQYQGPSINRQPKNLTSAFQFKEQL